MPKVHGLILLLFLSGCATYASINNKVSNSNSAPMNFSSFEVNDSERSSDITVILAFSGGGSRAATLSYGVLQALRDAVFNVDGQPTRLLDEVDVISSVSGGSFTAAYYGLYGDDIFTKFETDFLRRDINGGLLNGLLSPSVLFSKRGRTDMAVDYYQSNLFNGATFGDLQRQNGPLIVINASDLSYGVRFSFLQDYFDLLCSDLSSFPLAQAVAASSAVPVLFHPVVLQNHADCLVYSQPWLEQAKVNSSPQLKLMVEGLKSYAKKEERQFIHLVDGGITDNLGLLAIYDLVEAEGGVKRFLKAKDESSENKVQQRLIVISVNAATTPQHDIGQSNKVPSVDETIKLVTQAQIHRGNTATLELLQSSIREWASDLSTPGKTVEPYFIQLDFKSIPDESRKLYFNQIPTNFALEKEEVDNLIYLSHKLLGNNKEYQRLRKDLKEEGNAQ